MPTMVQVTGMVMETLSTLESSAEELEEIKRLPEASVRARRLNVIVLIYLDLVVIYVLVLNYYAYNYTYRKHKSQGAYILHFIILFTDHYSMRTATTSGSINQDIATSQFFPIPRI